MTIVTLIPFNISQDCLVINSFMFCAINVQEVKDLIHNLKSNKASIGIPNKCIKLALDHISEALPKVILLLV